MEAVELKDLQIGEVYEVDCGERGKVAGMSIHNTPYYEHWGCPFVNDETGLHDFLLGKQQFMYLGEQGLDDYFPNAVSVDLLVLIGDRKGYLNLLLEDPQNELGGPIQVITKAK